MKLILAISLAISTTSNAATFDCLAALSPTTSVSPNQLGVRYYQATQEIMKAHNLSDADLQTSEIFVATGNIKAKPGLLSFVFGPKISPRKLLVLITRAGQQYADDGVYLIDEETQELIEPKRLAGVLELPNRRQLVALKEPYRVTESFFELNWISPKLKVTDVAFAIPNSSSVYPNLFFDRFPSALDELTKRTTGLSLQALKYAMLYAGMNLQSEKMFVVLVTQDGHDYADDGTYVFDLETEQWLFPRDQKYQDIHLSNGHILAFGEDSYWKSSRIFPSRPRWTAGHVRKTGEKVFVLEAKKEGKEKTEVYLLTHDFQYGHIDQMPRPQDRHEIQFDLKDDRTLIAFEFSIGITPPTPKHVFVEGWQFGPKAVQALIIKGLPFESLFFNRYQDDIQILMNNIFHLYPYEILKESRIYDVKSKKSGNRFFILSVDTLSGVQYLYFSEELPEVSLNPKLLDGQVSRNYHLNDLNLDKLGAEFEIIRSNQPESEGKTLELQVSEGQLGPEVKAFIQ